MNKLLNILLCIDCRGELFRKRDNITYSRCGRNFLITNGVIDMLTEKSLRDEHNIHQQDYYDKEYEKVSANKDFEWRKRYKKRLIAYLPTDKTSIILDLASGQGYMMLALAKKGYRVIACDIAFSGLARSYNQAKKLGIENNILFILGDVNKLKFSFEAFSFIILLHVLEHMQHDKKVLQTLFHYSKNGCIYYIGVPLSLRYVFPLLKSAYTASDKKVGHIRRYTLESLSSLFGKRGKALSVIYTGHLIKFFGILLSLAGISRFDKWIEDMDERSLSNMHWASNITVVFRYIYD